MDEFFQNKYRTSTVRMNYWDYAWPAKYFVTICTKNRLCCLSEIKEGRVFLSDIGNIVFEDLLNIPIWRPYVALDDYIIMPNHIHVIFVLKADNDFGRPDGRDAVNRASTHREFGPLQPKSLSAIVNAFKGGVSRRCRKNKINFYWQSNYYEHVIKDEDDFTRIREYIVSNPAKWAEDHDNPINIKNFYQDAQINNPK